MEDDLESIYDIARSLVYRSLYDSLQMILQGGATKAQAEEIVCDSCSRVVANKDSIISFLDQYRFEEPLSSKQAFAKFLMKNGYWPQR